MAKPIYFLLSISLVAAIHLNIDNSINLRSSYELKCENVDGNVTYHVDNLPPGVRLNGKTIEIYDFSLVKEGYFVIRIRAEDTSGSTDEQIIVLIIQKQIRREGQAQKEKEQVDNKSVEKVQKILNELSVEENVIDKFESPKDGYPTHDFPQGANPSSVNYTPEKIMNQKAMTSQKNRNQITHGDVKFRSIFERQLNAAKALANLLKLIRESRASQGLLSKQMEEENKIYEQKLKEKRESEQNVKKAENDLERIRMGIQKTNEKISTTESQIKELQNLHNKKQIQQESLKMGLSNAKRAEKQQVQQIQSKKQEVKQSQMDLEKKKSECKLLKEELNSTQSNYGQIVLERVSLGGLMKGQTFKMERQQRQIDDLKQKLTKAEEQLQKTKKTLTQMDEKFKQLTKVIEQWKITLKNISQRIGECQKEVANLEQRISELKKNVLQLQNRLPRIQQQIQKLTSKIEQTSEEIEKMPTEILSNKENLAQEITTFRFLRAQAVIYEKQLFTLYSEANIAIENLKIAEQNLQQSKKEYEKLQEIIRSATQNIEKARIQKQLADKAVDEHLKQTVDILPFVHAPIQKGYFDAGEGIFMIQSWEKYVQIAFGSAIKPLFQGTVEYLYKAEVEGEKKEVNCAYDKLKAVSGFVVQIQEDGFTIINSQGEKIKIMYGDCTEIFSNMENYKITVGDIVVAKGIMVDEDEIIATQATFVQQQ